MEEQSKEQADKDYVEQMFEEDAKAIRDALMLVQESFNCIRYLLTKDSSPAVENSKREVFFALCIENFAYSIYINLHKLYSDGQDYSFFKFIKLITGEPYLSLNLPQDVVRSWRKKINEQRSLIEAVNGIRNNGIAHFRKRGEMPVLKYLTFTETEDLIKIAQNIFKDIYYHAFGKSLTIESPLNPTLDNLKLIIKRYTELPHLRAELQKLNLKMNGYDIGDIL